jgi:hypothetical protein
MFDPIILDNLFSEKYVNKIEESCTKSSWKYLNSITYDEDAKNTNYIQNGFTFSFSENSLQFFLFQYLILKSCEKINFKVDKIIRIRKRLTYPNKSKCNTSYHPHIDLDEEHLVLLYYVNDSDGDTFIHKENYQNEKNKPDNFSLLKRIKFTKGRVVIFDGKNYHSSSLSSKNYRIVLNINISGKFIK